MSEKKVFISYSHDSDAHREKVLALSERLRADGIETLLDQYVNGSPPRGWPSWMLDQIDAADSVLVVCTEIYYRRFRGHEVPGKGKGVDWEGALITLELYHSCSRTLKFVPVFLSAAVEDWIPEPLRSATHYALTSDDVYQRLYDFLLEQAHVEPGPIGTLKHRTPKKLAPLTFESETPSSDLVPSSSPTFATAINAGAADRGTASTNLRAEIFRVASFVAGKLVGHKTLRRVLLITVLLISLIYWWASKHILSTRELDSIIFDFVSARISSDLKQYYDKEVIDDKTRDKDLLRTLETKHAVASGTLTQRYFDLIEKQAHTYLGTPQLLIDSLTVRNRFAEAEGLAVVLVTEEEKKLLPDNRVICGLYNTAGWMAYCQDGYPGMFAQWLAVSPDQYQRAIAHFYKADKLTNKNQDRQLWAGPQLGIAAVRFRLGDCTGAESPIRESVSVRMEQKGEEKNSSDLGARTLWGQVLLECGDLTEAEKTLKTVYQIRMGISPKNPYTLMSWCDWGNALRAQKNARAEKEHEDAFDQCKSELGSEDLVTLYCQYNFAQTLSELGKNEKAETEFRGVTRLLKNRPGLKNRLTLDSLYQFACHLRKTGKFDEALKISGEVLECRHDLLGEGHPDTIKAGKLFNELKAR